MADQLPNIKHDDEEESVMVVELSGLPNRDLLKQNQGGTCAILGLDTGTPVVQIGSLVFKGRYEPAILGTTMVFEGSSATGLSYVCKTTNKLSTSRVVVKKKSTGSVEEEVVAMETEHH